MATIREKDEGGAGTGTQDYEVRVIQEQAQRGVAPLVDGVDTGALYNGFDKLFRGELASLRLVRIRQVDSLAKMVMGHSIGRTEGRRVILGICIRVWQIRKVMSAPL
jgi:hypothetical protein